MSRCIVVVRRCNVLLSVCLGRDVVVKLRYKLLCSKM